MKIFARGRGAIQTTMSTDILKYLKRPVHPGLPDPSGHLSLDVRFRAIAAANAEVERQAESRTRRKSKKRGHYYKYAQKERAEIARYAKMHGVSAVKRVFQGS